MRYPARLYRHTYPRLLVIGFIAAGCGVLIYKLYTLQIRDAEQYRVQAAEQQLSDTQIPATRGSIYSANGKLLAKSSVVWNIIANPSKCNQDYVAEAIYETALWARIPIRVVPAPESGRQQRPPCN